MIRAIDCSVLEWYKRSTLYIKSDRIDQCCESESYRISRQPTTDYADGCRQMSNMYGFIAAFATMSDLFQTVRFAFVPLVAVHRFICAGDDKPKQAARLNRSAQHNVIWWMLSRQRDIIPSRAPWKITHFCYAAGCRMACTMRSPCYLRCDGYIWIPWNYFNSLLRSPRRVPRSGDKLNNKNKNVVAQ